MEMGVYKFIKSFFGNQKIFPEKIDLTEYDILSNSISLKMETIKIINEKYIGKTVRETFRDTHEGL